MLKNIFLLAVVVTLAACDFQKGLDARFGDQHFKTAIALVELHKLRFGTYPETLNDLVFTGEWDPIAIGSVEYKRLDTGYELNLMRGVLGKPSVSYPPEFWKGLGLVKSNVKG